MPNGQPTAYAGKVSGFGGVGHANHTQFIDLVSVAFAPFEINATYSAGPPPAAVTVTSGGTTVAEIELVGKYADFELQCQRRRGRQCRVTDPAAGGGDAGPSSLVWQQRGMRGRARHHRRRAHHARGRRRQPARGRFGRDRRRPRRRRRAPRQLHLAASLVGAAGDHGGALPAEAASSKPQAVLSPPHH